MEKTTIAATMAVLVGILLVGSVLVPIIDYQTKETTNIQNTGAGELRYAYYDEPTGYVQAVTYDNDLDKITIGTQTVTATDMITWASNVGTIIYSDGGFTLLYDNEGAMTAVDLGLGYALSGHSDGRAGIAGLGMDTIEVTGCEWSYAPDSAGVFGFFTATGKVVKDFPTAAAGSFAGAYAYNELNSLGLSTLAPTYSVSGGVFNTGAWKLTANADNEDENEIESRFRVGTDYNAVPTPTYTDGDWGFNLSGTNAIIVSYSGAAGNLSIPATVSNGGTSYPVSKIGIGSNNSPIFDNTTITGSTITIPDSVETIGAYAFTGCSGFTGSLTIPDSVTSIGPFAFKDCSGFTGSLTIPDSVTSIGQYAFKGCSGFTGSLTIPDSVTFIGGYAFTSCSGFTGSLTIPDSVTSIGQSVFQGCSGFTGSLTIPDSVTFIGASAFTSCTGFTGPLTIPDSVTSIDAFAFQDCTGFTGIVILGSPTFGAYSFTNMTVDVLNLGETSISPGQYGLAADAVVSDEIASLGYIAPVSFSETVQKQGAEYDLMLVIPIVVIAGLLMAATVWFGLVRQKDY